MQSGSHIIFLNNLYWRFKIFYLDIWMTHQIFNLIYYGPKISVLVFDQVWKWPRLLGSFLRIADEAGSCLFAAKRPSSFVEATGIWRSVSCDYGGTFGRHDLLFQAERSVPRLISVAPRASFNTITASRAHDVGRKRNIKKFVVFDYWLSQTGPKK